MAKYAEQLEFCIINRYSPKEFIERCQEEGLPVSAENLHTGLYSELVKLDKANKNGVWARIIKNSFAPLFIGKVDYVAGNPPWVNWESLPGDYRETLKPIWERYGLFTLSGGAGRLGGGKKDISMLFVYCGIDNYLTVSGRLGFVITQTVFKTKGAGDGFRQWRFQQGDDMVYIRPMIVHDLSAIQVFEGATNRTAVLVCEKCEEGFDYPVPYVSWAGASRIDQDRDLASVLKTTTRRKLAAVPVEPGKTTSPWLTATKAALQGIQRVIGESKYRGYEGANTGGLNGCYWVKIIQTLRGGHLLIENLADIGKIKLARVQAEIEPDLVYPLLRGRDVVTWYAAPSAHIILAQDAEKGRGIAEAEMKKKFPKTYAYLRLFEGDKARPERGTLRGRALFKRYFRPTDPFYSMYNIGPQTLSPWKVVWRDMGSRIQVAVIGERDGRYVCPEHHVMAVSLEAEDEAHYIAGILMSSPVQLLVAGYTTSTGMSTHVLDVVNVPTFRENDALHCRLSEASQQCHAAVSRQTGERLGDVQAQIDKCAAKVWGITPTEMDSILTCLEECPGAVAVEQEENDE